MKKEAVTLTAMFNEASVKKGDTFQIELMAGGFVGATWEAEVVSGEATLVGKKSGAGNVYMQKWAFRAEEKGEIEIRATEQRLGNTQTFKVKVS